MYTKATCCIVHAADNMTKVTTVTIPSTIDMIDSISSLEVVSSVITSSLLHTVLCVLYQVAYKLLLPGQRQALRKMSL
jgi:hypothetical protein